MRSTQSILKWRCHHRTLQKILHLLKISNHVSGFDMHDIRSNPAHCKPASRQIFTVYLLK